MTDRDAGVTGTGGGRFSGIPESDTTWEVGLIVSLALDDAKQSMIHWITLTGSP